MHPQPKGCPIRMHISSMGPSESPSPPFTPGPVSFLSVPPPPRTPRSPFLTLSTSSRPPGVHSLLRPGLAIPPYLPAQTGQGFHPRKGGGLLAAAVMTVTVIVIAFHAPLLPTSPRRGKVPAPAFQAESPCRRSGPGMSPRPALRPRTCLFPPLQLCPRVGVPGQGREKGRFHTRLQHPELTEVRVQAPPLPPASRLHGPGRGREPPGLGSDAAGAAPRGRLRAGGLASLPSPALRRGRALRSHPPSSRWGRPGCPF